MFNELQEYINVANFVTEEFDSEIERAEELIAGYEAQLSESDNSKDYYNSFIREEKIKIQMIEAMKTAVIKIVKSAV